jgi:hypothetical protein
MERMEPVMRHFTLILAILAVRQGFAEEQPKQAPDHVVVHVKVVELQSDGKAKVVAEPVLRTNLKKPISFNLGDEVPVKVPLGKGLGTMIDYVPVGIRWELTFERIEGDAVWGNLVMESVQRVDDKDGLFTTQANQRRKRGKFASGKTVKTAPIKVSEDASDKRQLQFEFRVELASSSDIPGRAAGPEPQQDAE